MPPDHRLLQGDVQAAGSFDRLHTLFDAVYVEDGRELTRGLRALRDLLDFKGAVDNGGLVLWLDGASPLRTSEVIDAAELVGLPEYAAPITEFAALKLPYESSMDGLPEWVDATFRGLEDRLYAVDVDAALHAYIARSPKEFFVDWHRTDVTPAPPPVPDRPADWWASCPEVHGDEAAISALLAEIEVIVVSRSAAAARGDAAERSTRIRSSVETYLANADEPLTRGDLLAYAQGLARFW